MFGVYYFFSLCFGLWAMVLIIHGKFKTIAIPVILFCISVFLCNKSIEDAKPLKKTKNALLITPTQAPIPTGQWLVTPTPTITPIVNNEYNITNYGTIIINN